jgi:hypothetical protein
MFNPGAIFVQELLTTGAVIQFVGCDLSHGKKWTGQVRVEAIIIPQVLSRL